MRFSEISELFVNKNLVHDYCIQFLFCVYQYIFFFLSSLCHVLMSAIKEIVCKIKETLLTEELNSLQNVKR